jgi:hypothetical protein
MQCGLLATGDNTIKNTNGINTPETDKASAPCLTDQRSKA